VTIPSPCAARSNRLLACVPRLDRILPDLTLKPLALRQVLQARGEPLHEVVFPVAGVASMVSTGDSGDSAEVATIGREGFVGLPLLLGARRTVVEVFVQLAGAGLFMSASAFHRHLQEDPDFMHILLRYAQAMLTQAAQNSLCNLRHLAQARCARWLLQTHDRVDGDEFPLTHEFLGLMLGVRRATVTETAGALQKRGLIRYSRGVIAVVDRKGLEAAACECYQLVTEEFDRVVGPRRGRGGGP
jgi:CRP-like cAMP-binding protein